MKPKIDEPPKELWRVASLRDFEGKPLLHHRFLHYEESAREYVRELGAKGMVVLSCTRYVMIPED